MPCYLRSIRFPRDNSIGRFRFPPLCNSSGSLSSRAHVCIGYLLKRDKTMLFSVHRPSKEICCHADEMWLSITLLLKGHSGRLAHSVHKYFVSPWVLCRVSVTDWNVDVGSIISSSKPCVLFKDVRYVFVTSSCGNTPHWNIYAF